jgi:hypothetical protein
MCGISGGESRHAVQRLLSSVTFSSVRTPVEGSASASLVPVPDVADLNRRAILLRYRAASMRLVCRKTK